MQIDKLHIYSINDCSKSDKFFDMIRLKEPSNVNYIKIGVENFTEFLNKPDVNFLEYNKDSLYILRNGCYMDVKNIFTRINGYDTNVGRGGSQKAHMISPLDLRLSCYLMALFNFDYKLISNLNSFNNISKNRYLPYFSRYY